MIEILMNIRAIITVIVVENREPYYFIIICKCKKVPPSLFSYHMLASTSDYDERYSPIGFWHWNGNLTYFNFNSHKKFLKFYIFRDTIENLSFSHMRLC